MACPPSANIQLYGSSILHPKGKQWFYIFKYASRKPGIWAAKNPDKIGVFAEHIFFMFLLWRRVRDSNPRCLAAHDFSRVAPSTTRTTLQVVSSPNPLWKMGRTDGENSKIFSFSNPRKTCINQDFFGWSVPRSDSDFELESFNCLLTVIKDKIFLWVE